MNPSEATPRIATRKNTPTTMRRALRAPPPEPGAGEETGGATGAPAGAGDEVSIAAPHLLQKLVPGAVLAPQELQNGIGHLMGMYCCKWTARVYRRLEQRRNALRRRLKAAPFQNESQIILAPEAGGVVGHG